MNLENKMEMPQTGKKAVIETAHTYLGEVSPEAIERQAVLADDVFKILQGAGYDGQKVVLLDQVKSRVAGRHSLLDGWRYAAAIARTEQKIKNSLTQGYEVVGESPFIKAGEQQVLSLSERINHGGLESVRLVSSGQKVQIGKAKGGDKITLRSSYETERGGLEYLPSCEVLDMVFYKEKLETSELAVTILPQGYKSQQDRVRKLFEIEGETPPVVVVYFDPETYAVTEVDSWQGNQELQGLLGVLKD